MPSSSSGPRPGHLLTPPGVGLFYRPLEPQHAIHVNPTGRTAERLAEAGFDMSIASAGDIYDNAVAKTVIELFKTEVIKHLDP